jgi:hypothetical protein
VADEAIGGAAIADGAGTAVLRRLRAAGIVAAAGRLVGVRAEPRGRKAARALVRDVRE